MSFLPTSWLRRPGGARLLSPLLGRFRRARRRQAAADYLAYDGPERRARPRRRTVIGRLLSPDPSTTRRDARATRSWPGLTMGKSTADSRSDVGSAAVAGGPMSISLTDHEDVELDVHTVRDRAALVVNGQMLWMNRAEVETLRLKLMLALRMLDFPAVPTPREKR